MKTFVGVVTLVSLGVVASAGAQCKVAIAAAASTSGFPTACQWTDTQASLMSSGLFSAVDFVDVNSSTPSLATLMDYDAVLTFTNGSYFDEIALGDVMADYVDAGGGVVVAVFANSTTTAKRSLLGRWSQGYDVIIPRTGNQSGAASLGVVHDPGHSIMQGVMSFNGGTSSFRPSVTNLTAGSTEVAEWSDGRTLVAVGANPARVDLGFYPVSSVCSATFWQQGTDGAKLLSNALAFAGGCLEPGCYADCDQSGSLDFFDFLCFQNEFSAGTAYADCDENGTLDFFDFLCFQNAFAAGCP